LIKSKRRELLWVDADSEKCAVEVAKKPGALFLSYTLSTRDAKFNSIRPSMYYRLISE
jgi:hypothetical protein